MSLHPAPAPAPPAATPEDGHVLCLQRDWLERKTSVFHGFLRAGYFSDVLQRAATEQTAWSWQPRSLCETDPTWKQLIPYLVVLNPAGEVLTYRRSPASGENRLHGKRSIGLGGHVQRSDGATPWPALRCAAQRELAEEFPAATSYTMQLAGLLNDDSTAVGSVHLGVVLVVALRHNVPAPPDGELAAAEFLPLASLFTFYDPGLHAEFEDWSRLLLVGHVLVRENQPLTQGPIVWASNS
jgi:predicted NUDIX family phosphoesterase